MVSVKVSEEWVDTDEDKFNQELSQRAQQFLRVENINFLNNGNYGKISVCDWH